MPRIRWIEQEDATGDLAEAYEVVRRTWPPADGAAEIFKALSHYPGFMRAMSDAALLPKQPKALTPAQHEMIALHVSVLSQCFY